MAAVTMKDVAKRAGVSTITVSRVVNSTGYVHPSTRAKVRAVIAELHYIPNQMASSLRSRQTSILALILPTITNSFWTTITRGAEDEAEARGYSIFLCNTDDDPSKEARYLEALLRHRVDGVVIVPTASSAGTLHRLQRHQMAFVQLHRKIEGIESDVVRGDSRGGAFALTRHLLDSGRRQIAYVGGPLSTFTGRDRLAGYEEALARAGIERDPALVKIGTYRQQTGYELVKELLQPPARPEAVFIANSTLAIGALHALTEAGIRMPRDIAVASYYDIPALDDYSPFMTTAIQPAYEIGRLGVSRLLARIAGTPDAMREIILPNRILAR